jgi:ABC-type phosphate transport system substrate-binding protein
MNTLRLLLIAVILSVSIPAWAEKVAVIVNMANQQTLTADDIKNIYLDNIITWANGDRIKAYDLPVKDNARQVFSNKVLHMRAQNVAREWANKKITNTAKNPPRTTRGRLVAAFVAKDPDAIGYVPAAMVEGHGEVRVVMTVE